MAAVIAGYVEFCATQLFAVGNEILRDSIGKRAEHQVHRVLKERSIGPHRTRRAETFISRGKQRRLRKPPFQFADDTLCVAIDIGADLHHRRASITSRQGHQIGARHDSGNDYGGPIDIFKAEDHTNLFREWRLLEMMQDDWMCGRHQSLMAGAVGEADPPIVTLPKSGLTSAARPA